MNTSIKTLAALQWYTEGPVMDEAGNIYCTTLQGGKIIKIDTDGILSDWATSNCPNGQLILPGGDHLICESELAAISRFNSDGNFLGHDLQGFCDGHQVYVPNDLVVDEEGGVYFTDSIRHNGKVCYYAPGGRQQVIASGIDFPNGIALSNDGRLLYIAESYQNRILVIPLKSSGTPDGGWQVFSELPAHFSGDIIKNLPDGIKTDDTGCLWVAHYGMQAVQVLSAAGMLINSIDTTLPLTSNLFLHHNTVIVTGGYSEPGPGGVIKINIE
jgi:gluconolactonase